MTFNTLYAGQVNSPNTTLSSGIDDDDTTIPVTELGVFPAGPNLATIGTGSTAETILYTDKSAASGSGNLTGCTRAYDSDGTYGVAASWESGEVIARNFCEHDWATIKNNAEYLNTTKIGSPITVTVGASGCKYTTVTAALAAITDNAADKQYAIVLHGDVTDTALITWKSYVHLIGVGATWTINTNTAGAGITASNLSGISFRDVTVIRSGTVTATSLGMYIIGTTTFNLDHVTVRNTVDASTGENTAGYVGDTATGTINNCAFTCDVTTSSGHGLNINSTGSIYVYNSTGTSGAAAVGYRYGINSSGANIVFIGCTGKSRGSTYGRAFSLSAGVAYNCVGISEASGADSPGILATGTASFVGCTGISKSAAANHGIEVAGSPTLISCVGQHGPANGSYGICLKGNSSAVLTGCSNTYAGVQSYLSFTGSNDEIQPISGKPYTVTNLYVLVHTAADVGSPNLDIGTTYGGTEIAQVDISSTGNKYFSINYVGIAADSPIYVVPDDTDARFNVYYTVIENYSTNYGIYIDTQSAAKISGCLFNANEASSGAYITTAARTAGLFQMSNCVMSTSGSATYSLTAQSAGRVPVKQSTFNGAILNAIPQGKVVNISMVVDNTGVTATTPDTSYTEDAGFTMYRTGVDFRYMDAALARVIVSGIGDEAGNGKGVEIYDTTNAASIAAVTWDGNAQQNAVVGAWTTCTTITDVVLAVRVKGSSATEDITLNKVVLQLMEV